MNHDHPAAFIRWLLPYGYPSTSPPQIFKLLHYASTRTEPFGALRSEAVGCMLSVGRKMKTEIQAT